MRILWMLLFSLGIFNLLHAQDDFQGMASYYADQFVGRKTASGEIYQHNKMTCAHKSLPFGTKLKVTNPSNDKSVILTVNDRGPFSHSRVLDVSKSAAQQLGMLQKGVALLKIEILEEGEQDESNLKTTELLNAEKTEDGC